MMNAYQFEFSHGMFISTEVTIDLSMALPTSIGLNAFE